MALESRAAEGVRTLRHAWRAQHSGRSRVLKRQHGLGPRRSTRSGCCVVLYQQRLAVAGRAVVMLPRPHAHVSAAAGGRGGRQAGEWWVRWLEQTGSDRDAQYKPYGDIPLHAEQVAPFPGQQVAQTELALERKHAVGCGVVSTPPRDLQGRWRAAATPGRLHAAAPGCSAPPHGARWCAVQRCPRRTPTLLLPLVPENTSVEVPTASFQPHQPGGFILRHSSFPTSTPAYQA